MEQMTDQMEQMKKEMEQMRKQLEQNQTPNQDGDILVGVVKLIVGVFLITYALFTFL